MRNAYNIFEGKSEWKRKLGRLRCRWNDTVKINFKERGLADSSDTAQGLGSDAFK